MCEYLFEDKEKNCFGWWRNNLAMRNKRNSIRWRSWNGINKNLYLFTINVMHRQTDQTIKVYVAWFVFIFLYILLENKIEKISLFIEFHEQKSNLCHYVKLNHDAMIVVSKNKERKNVENCSRQKYRKVEIFWKKKKDNKSIIHIRYKYNSMKFSFIRMNN